MSGQHLSYSLKMHYRNANYILALDTALLPNTMTRFDKRPWSGKEDGKGREDGKGDGKGGTGTEKVSGTNKPRLADR